MMISRQKTQVWANVPKELKRRLEALREVDPVVNSESRVIWRCLEAWLPTEEAKILNFKIPAQGAPGKRKRAA